MRVHSVYTLCELCYIPVNSCIHDGVWFCIFRLFLNFVTIKTLQWTSLCLRLGLFLIIPLGRVPGCHWVPVFGDFSGFSKGFHWPGRWMFWKVPKSWSLWSRCWVLGVAFNRPVGRRPFLSFELPWQAPHDGQQVTSPPVSCIPGLCIPGHGELWGSLGNPTWGFH